MDKSSASAGLAHAGKTALGQRTADPAGVAAQKSDGPAGVAGLADFAGSVDPAVALSNSAVVPKRSVALELAMPFYPVRRSWAGRELLVASEVDRAAYVGALAREALGAAPDYADCRIPAVQVGGCGGIAGHMADEELGRLLRSLRQAYDLTCADGSPAQIALTVHPGMVSAATLDACRRGHVTRLEVDYATSSSTEARELGRFMGPEAFEVTRMVLGTSRLELAFGLLAGIPGQTERSALASVETVLGFGGVAVDVARVGDDCARGSARACAHIACTAIEEAMGERLRTAGFYEYLPGSWALPGHESRSKQLRAQGYDLLGFGLAAETRFAGMGACNTSDLATYLTASDDPARCIVRCAPLV